MGPVTRFLYAAVVPFALFGPLLIVNGVSWSNGVARLSATAGAILLGLAVVAVYRRQLELAERLDGLERAEPARLDAEVGGAGAEAV